MGTSKEMQLKILDRMRQNIESDKHMFDGIYFFSHSHGDWLGESVIICSGFKSKKYKIDKEPDDIGLE